jgi:asparagine synthase (glutamine-hydrolysing)
MTGTTMSRGIAGRIVRRVGILVPESAPAATESLDCQVLVWGNLANRKDLAERLGVPNSGPKSDTSLIAAAYRLWGEQLPSHVLGEFAVALYDRHTDRAFLTHDSLGLTSLYYSNADRVDGHADELTFATHLVDLLDGEVTARLDEEYLADFLARGSITTARTPFLAIRRLLPGCSLSWASGHVTESRHWSLADAPPVALRDDEEYESRFRTSLEAGVRGAIDGARVVWTHLSGGLDSSTVASIAARLEAPGLAAWSVYCPRFADVDERKWMREVVDRYRLPWHLVNIEETLPFSAPPADFLGEPSISVIHTALSRANDRLYAAHGVEVILSGHGGDGVLGASPGPEASHLADYLFAGNLVGALRGIYRWRRESTERRSYSYWLQHCLLRPALQHLRGQGISAAPRLPLQPWFQPEYQERMHLDQRRRQRYAARCQTPGRQQLADGLLVAALRNSLDAQRQRNHRVYNPLLYRPLVEFMCAIPLEQNLRPKCDRYLQRRALKGILPESIRRRASKGVGTPTFVEGLSRSPEWVDYLTQDSRLAAYGIADAGLWRLAVQQASVGQTNGDQFFHAGLAVEVWLRQLEEHRRMKPSLPVASRQYIRVGTPEPETAAEERHVA